MVKKYFDHPKIYGGDEIKTALTTKNEKQNKKTQQQKQLMRVILQEKCCR